MKIEKLSHKTYKVITEGRINESETAEDLQFLKEKQLATFGDLNTRILAKKLRELGYQVETVDLCLEDDISIGLPMPNITYLNTGGQAISIPMYYNFLTFKEMAKRDALFSTNEVVAEEFGRIGLVEVFFQRKLESFLDERGITYFGTPKTLTECMRVLEGWNLDRVPRLKNYVSFANFIFTWCKSNFPDFKEEEWFLGEEKSAELFESKKTTNVRDGIKYFWNNYLIKKVPKVSAEDVEIDVVGGNFYNDRKPDFILVGEDVFAQKGKDKIVFRSFSGNEESEYSRRNTKNKKNLKTAELIREMFPDTTIVLFESPRGESTFTMSKLDEVKEGISEEVGFIARGLRLVLEMRKPNFELEVAEDNQFTLLLKPLLEKLGISDSSVVKAELQKGHSVLVYKLTISQEQNRYLIVKTTEDDDQGVKLDLEYRLYQSLQDSTGIIVPEVLFQWKQEGKTRIAYEFIEGTTVSNTEIDLPHINSILTAIQKLQTTLSNSDIPEIKVEMDKIGNNVLYCEKMSKYVRSHLGVSLNSSVFKVLETELNTNVSKTNKTIVSDRSPSNWIIRKNGKIALLDLGLVRIGNREEDWIWFIDNSSLKTNFNRNQLIEFYLLTSSNEADSYQNRKKRFHLVAIYLNVLQTCFLFKKDKNASLYSLQMAIDSAEFLGSQEMMKELNKLGKAFNFI